MNPKHDPEVAFLRKIAASRAVVRDFVTFGRLGYPPTRVGASVAIFSAPADEAGFPNRGPFPKLSASIWIAPNETAAVLLLVAPTHEDVAADYDLDVARWYLHCNQRLGRGYTVSTLRPKGQREVVGTYASGSIVKVRQVVPGRGVIIIHIECQAAA